MGGYAREGKIKIPRWWQKGSLLQRASGSYWKLQAMPTRPRRCPDLQREIVKADPNKRIDACPPQGKLNSTYSRSPTQVPTSILEQSCDRGTAGICCAASLCVVLRGGTQASTAAPPRDNAWRPITETPSCAKKATTHLHARS